MIVTTATTPEHPRFHLLSCFLSLLITYYFSLYESIPFWIADEVAHEKRNPRLTA